MSTIAQIDANGRNAQHSTGPKTPVDKAVSRRNATTHGLLANESVLPIENMAEFEQLLSAFLDEYHPTSPTEDFFVRQMADAQWRLRRHQRMETGALDTLVHQALSNNRPDICWNISDPDLTPGERARRRHERQTGALGCAFLSRPESLAVLQRYENNLRRQFCRSLEELRRLRTHPIPQPDLAAASQPAAIDACGAASQVADSTLVSSPVSSDQSR